METRLEKGKQIAKAGKVREKAGTWLVPSQSRTGTGYVVKFTPDGYTCDCPDYEFRHQDCKHIYAVCVVVTQRETVTERVERVAANGAKTVTTKTVTVEKRGTYPQNWPAYNKAQTEEKHTFLRLLADLCSGIEEPAQPATGRRHLPLRDMLFCAALKVYSTVSGRRAQCDLQDACDKGYIARVPHFNSVFNTFEREDLTAILERLIVTSSAPLAAVEQDFAVDSTGLTTTRFVRWYDAKYGDEMAQHEWIKLHLMCGVKTNIVTSVLATHGSANDSPILPLLVGQTAARFTMRDVSADKGYISKRNLQEIMSRGAQPYIPFKSNATGGATKGTTLWKRLYHFYEFQRETFLAHYHKRSNVETTFHMIKSKFGDALRSKTQVAQFNEAMCKVLCHNICVVIQSMHELGISPDFGAAQAA
ncbi:MAG TPA: transposase [Chloroflexota bacterium]|nr:transposase [Chloroflexota bacterium]